MSISLDVLKEQPLFSALSRETLMPLAQYMVQKNYLADEIIQMEGEVCAYIAFVQSGAARVYRLTLAGREQVLATLTRGMHFNSVPAIISDGNESQCYRSSVRALTPLSLLLLPVEPYRNMLKTYPDLSFAVLSDFANRLDHLTNLVEDLSLHSVRGRLARFLLDQADRGELNERWTQDEVAAHLGTVRDVVGRTLRDFMDAGLVRREGAKLVLLDREGLEKEAQS